MAWFWPWSSSRAKDQTVGFTLSSHLWPFHRTLLPFLSIAYIGQRSFVCLFAACQKLSFTLISSPSYNIVFFHCWYKVPVLRDRATARFILLERPTVTWDKTLRMQVCEGEWLAWLNSVGAGDGGGAEVVSELLPTGLVFLCVIEHKESLLEASANISHLPPPPPGFSTKLLARGCQRADGTFKKNLWLWYFKVPKKSYIKSSVSSEVSSQMLLHTLGLTFFSSVQSSRSVSDALILPVLLTQLYGGGLLLQ